MYGRFQRGISILLAVGVVSGCGLPVSVRKVEPEKPVRGIRYVLKRPKFVVGLQVDPKDILDAPAARSLDAVALCSDPNGCPAVSRPPFCVRNHSEVALVVRQTMEGAALQYEVGGPDVFTAITNSFAETDFSITLADDGALNAVSAGATDRSLEFIQAVAGLAVQAAKSSAGLAAAQEPDCFVIPGDDFPEYVKRQRELIAARDQLTKTLDAAIVALPAQKPPEVADSVDGIQTLQTQRAAVVKELSELMVPLLADNYILTVDGKAVNTGTKPLLTVALTNTRMRKGAK